MSENLIDLAVTQFSANLEMKIQQKGSKLRGRVAEGTHVGKQASPVQYLGPVKVQVPAGRFAPLAPVHPTFERRWVFPKDRDLPQLVDSFDELRLISDPKSQYSSNAAAAVAREWDDQLIAAAKADARIGTDVDALSTESFDDTTYGVAVNYGASAANGLTVAKLRELKRKMRHYAQDGSDDDEMMTILIGSQQESDLLAETQITNSDYNGDRPVLVDGSIKRFLGFDFIVSERLAVASNVRSCIAFMKSGLYLGIWSDTSTTPSIRNDLSGHPYQLYTKFTVGATRLQKGKLFEVKCSDTTGASITP
ncbi:MAG: phage capsid protein [Reyranella sp.]|uniref:phage capsid protein n=1 Tax=Reyranella sp. TaxID=1929291 RepID=UPI003D106A31